MRLPTTTVSDTKATYASLIAWSKADYREEINTSRYEVFEDLFEGLASVEKRVADPESLAALLRARSLAERARELYRAGDFKGGILTIQDSHEAFLDVRYLSKSGKVKNVPLI